MQLKTPKISLCGTLISNICLLMFWLSYYRDLQTLILGRGIPRNILACPKEQENYSNASKKSLISADPQRLGQWGNARNWRKLSWKWKRCRERQLATYHLIPFSCSKAILVSMCAMDPSPLCLYIYNGWECEEARCKRVSRDVRIAQCRPLTAFLNLRQCHCVCHRLCQCVLSLSL